MTTVIRLDIFLACVTRVLQECVTLSSDDVSELLGHLPRMCYKSVTRMCYFISDDYSNSYGHLPRMCYKSVLLYL